MMESLRGMRYYSPDLTEYSENYQTGCSEDWAAFKSHVNLTSRIGLIGRMPLVTTDVLRRSTEVLPPEITGAAMAAQQ